MLSSDLNITEEEIERRDYDSSINSNEETLTLRVNYRVHPASGDELAFGHLAFPHVRPEPWGPGELESWVERWRTLVLERLNEAFELLVYTGDRRPGAGGVEISYRHSRGLHAVGVRAGGESWAGRSSWEMARIRSTMADVIRCRLELNAVEPGARTHLQILAAKARPRSSSADTPYHGVELAASGTADDIDMLLFEGDLSPRNGAQTRALNQFGRYLGCWSRGGDAGNDLMGRGDELHPWHGWPWWRRLADHVDATDREFEERRGRGRYYASVVVIRLRQTGERSHASELEDAAANGSNAEQQEMLRRDPDDMPSDEWMGLLIPCWSAAHSLSWSGSRSACSSTTPRSRKLRGNHVRQR